VTGLRSLLFVPGNAPNMLDKALGFRPDAYVPDMEDSVPDSEKDNARQVIRAYLAKLSAAGPWVAPRVNALNSGLIEADLAAVVGPSIGGVTVGKIQTADDIRAISEILAGLEHEAGLPGGTIKLIPWIETALAVVHCYAICCASPRIVAVAFGAEDFTDDMGIERSEDESEVAYAKNTVCIAARAAGVTAIDTPYFRFKDQPGLRVNALAAKRCGFKGKFAIHPAQIETINDAFSPSEAELEHARRVVAAFEEAERSGRGSTSLDGKVIDVPVFKRARALLDLADATKR
jgi:citrate lyase subunit beta/citryl-CoA lyase